MKSIVLALSIACLVANLAPSILYLLGRIDLPTAKSVMMWTTLAWYGVAAFLIYGNFAPRESALDADREPFVP